MPKGGGVYKIGSPYQVSGQWFVPRPQPGYDKVGIASWYGTAFHGRRTANGEVYDMTALTAAHPTLPLPSYAYVTNLDNGRTILVRVNDRGPYVADRVIDLSQASARLLGYERGGLGRVRVRYAGPAPLDGNEARERQFLASRTWSGGSRFAETVPYAPPPRPREYASEQWSAPLYRAGLASR
jgi:rare lipoprotein A